MADDRIDLSKLSDEDLDRISKALATNLLSERRAIKTAEGRVNVKPRRPVDYFYGWGEYLSRLDVSGTDFRVLFHLIGLASPQGVIQYSASEVARELNLAHGSMASRSIRALVNAGALERLSRGVVRPNPAVIWRGSSAVQVKLLGEQIARRLSERNPQ